MSWAGYTYNTPYLPGGKGFVLVPQPFNPTMARASRFSEAKDKLAKTNLDKVDIETLAALSCEPWGAPQCYTKDKYPLLLACYLKGYREGMQSLYEAKSLLNVVTPAGDNLLHLSAVQGVIEVAKEALKVGIHVDAKNQAGATPYFLACAANRLEVVQLLQADSRVSARAVFEQPTHDGMTPFLVACLEGNTDIVRFLSTLKINFKACTKTGETAVHLAALNNHFPVLRELKRLGVPFDTKNAEGLTPAEFSLKYGTGEAGLWLKGCVAIPEDKVKSARQLCEEGLIEENEAMFKSWMEAGINVNGDSGHGFSLLHVACDRKQLPAIQMLLDKKVRPESLNVGEGQNSSPLTCLINNATLACVPLVEALLRAGANPNAKGMQAPDRIKDVEKHARYPLDHAICIKDKAVRLAVMKALLLAGAIVDEEKLGEKGNKVTGGYTHLAFLHLGCLTGCGETVELLLDHGAKFNVYDVKFQLFSQQVQQVLEKHKVSHNGACVIS